MTTITFRQRLVDSLLWPAILIAVLWIVQLIQFALPGDLGYLGIYPRQISGLRGILFTPLIHGDWGHLASNTPPLFALSAILMFFYRKVAVPSFLLTYFLTGLAVWLFARPVFHIGASGVVYGLVSFVFFSGIFRRNLKSIVLALIVLMYYGSMFMGILPGQEGISWESHLMGGVVGILVAFLYKNKIEDDEKPKRYSWEEDPKQLEEDYFLDRDVFEKTRRERLQEPPKNNDGWFSNSSW